ncbi:3-deoxy-manno-octulosonate cytidylyltransferase [Roseimaritima multifibrata]|uniref:3-deoxy-manno-octulosonate cytidylyltransferase n=1 Tax=Roseimaritima multifibrata TaxID=1930274 RepID=A0A517MNA4_9BACT|nr:NTP transferase domain-containing protein [Roseimaritima multifibrata]QDS96359.1 3-deoxy-manno-octulosonate cytidylyltransferase [Roseimaritima multifibrata]
MKKFPAVVLARMTSVRLPGKGLRQVAGRPLLAYLLDTLRQSEAIGEVFLATSDTASDFPLVDFAKESSVSVVQGPLEDVATRFLMAVKRSGADAAFRVNGDSPFVPLELFSLAAERYRSTQVDLVSNIFPRSFPVGQSVELVSRKAIECVLSRPGIPSDREHVTQYLYRNSAEFQIENIKSAVDYSAIRFAVDDGIDFAKVSRMLSVMTRPHWSYTVEELVKLSHSCGQ